MTRDKFLGLIISAVAQISILPAAAVACYGFEHGAEADAGHRADAGHA